MFNFGALVRRRLGWTTASGFGSAVVLAWSCSWVGARPRGPLLLASIPTSHCGPSIGIGTNELSIDLFSGAMLDRPRVQESTESRAVGNANTRRKPGRCPALDLYARGLRLFSGGRAEGPGDLTESYLSPPNLRPPSPISRPPLAPHPHTRHGRTATGKPGLQPSPGQKKVSVHPRIAVGRNTPGGNRQQRLAVRPRDRGRRRRLRGDGPRGGRGGEVGGGERCCEGAHGAASATPRSPQG